MTTGSVYRKIRSLGGRDDVVQLGANDRDGLGRAFQAMNARGIQGAVVMTDAYFATRLATIVEQAALHRVPALYGFSEFTEAGGLMSYGISFREYYKGLARYVDAVLRGAPTADMPVQQPTRIGLVVNQNTARTLGLTLPPAILQRADRLIG